MSSSALACACCAERGVYEVYTSTPKSPELEILKDMRFGTTPELYLTAADDGAIMGMGDLGEGDLSLVDAYTKNIWRIEIKTAGGKSGVLMLPRPARMTTRLIDLREKTQGEPVVYKEFMFDGIVGSGSGLFKSGIVRTTKYTLIFQGRGNMCHNAEDFTHWHLKVKGPRADYAFFGKMRNAA